MDFPSCSVDMTMDFSSRSDENEKVKGKSDWNEALEGLKDFGQSKLTKSNEFFFTFETSDYRNAKHLFHCIREKLQGQILITYKCSDGFTDSSLVHLYYKNEYFKFPPVPFKSFMEEISGMKCLEIKKVIYKRALLKSMTPRGCPVVYNSEIPNEFLGEDCRTQKPKTTTTSTKQMNNLPGLTGQSSSNLPASKKEQTLEAQAEAFNPHKELLEKKEALVRFLEKSLTAARAERKKTRNVWRQWNLKYVNLMKERNALPNSN